MTVGEMISDTRKGCGFTQEQYGDKFGVTRQTVSSWENERSYPDLQTLIKICDEFHVSLDVLLREDTTMVKNVDRGIAMRRTIYVGVRILGALLLLFTVYIGIWYGCKVKYEKQFTATMERRDFKLQKGVYVSEKNGITYTAPNQKLPLFHFEFYNTILTVDYYLKDDLRILMVAPDHIILQANNDHDISLELDREGNMKGKPNIEEKEIYIGYEDKVYTMVERGMLLYEEIYP